jgi:thiol-disulfide isomerase/thioredoxin
MRYFRPDLTGMAEAPDDEAGTIADIDQPFPHAVLPTLDGNWMDMGSYKGKVLLINFWATWCPPCRDEIPELIKLQEQFASQRFTIVGIAVDAQDEQSVKSFVQSKRSVWIGCTSRSTSPSCLGATRFRANSFRWRTSNQLSCYA